VVENLRREGLAPEPLLAECREILEARLREYVRSLAREVASPPPIPQTALNGEAYAFYRGDFSKLARDGELASLLGLDGQLAFARPASAASFLSEALRDGLARVELSSVYSRVKYLRGWLSHLLENLPPPQSVKSREVAEQAFDRLVKSRFPLLALKEGELVRLKGLLNLLGGVPGELGESARKVEGILRSVEDDFSRFSRQVLELRATL
jgi:hypothetical protein